ncbi:HupE/UreJ family protein [Draconibacterium sp. IB214405]|uniref:HupE/UreJ family protein n=1 Tax=Draconibacterium sp. IB214405 TaxID=3097352 RepID=UPI002A16927B|nr:HupE/UreJ family protein [Draconibacterium sp. IB214405]MDX8339857.1 HupE/UreJ family protein [Draconibacterium sp. IB214405]
MSLFEMYLKLGFKHIIDIHGFDHIVFVLVLCAGYNLNQFKKVLILITAFTIGHSITLALSTLKILSVSSDLIEFLIPATICITAIANILPFKAKSNRVVYVLTLFFGLIHGLGFSNYLKQLLGRESNILTPLLAFNVGLELGQILILAIYFSLLFITVQLFKIRNDFWRIFVSGMAFGISVILMIDKGPALF